MQIHVYTVICIVCTLILTVHTYSCYICRVGDGTVPLAIVLYIDGSFVKHKIPVRPIYVTVRNLNSVVSGKARAWRVLGMMPGLRKSATLAQSDTWRKDRRLRLRVHHACIAHVVDMVNRFCGEDKHILCADGQVHTCLMLSCTMYILSTYNYIHCILMFTLCTYMDIILYPEPYGLQVRRSSGYLDSLRAVQGCHECKVLSV